MKKFSWILIILVMASFSGRLVSNCPSLENNGSKKSTQKKSTSRQEEEALGTMMLLPISFQLEEGNTTQAN